MASSAVPKRFAERLEASLAAFRGHLEGRFLSDSRFGAGIRIPDLDLDPDPDPGSGYGSGSGCGCGIRIWIRISGSGSGSRSRSGCGVPDLDSEGCQDCNHANVISLKVFHHLFHDEAE